VELIGKKFKNTSRVYLEQVVANLILQGFLQEDFHFTPYSIISYIVLGARGKNTSGTEKCTMKVQKAKIGSSRTEQVEAPAKKKAKKVIEDDDIIVL
jgi:ATP-dependent DNA helicase Q1